MLKPDTNIKGNSQGKLNSLTRSPVIPKPTMLPKLELAAQKPKACPSVYRSKYSFVSVRSVGQAGNWQKPNRSNPRPGIKALLKIFNRAESPSMSELRGSIK